MQRVSSLLPSWERTRSVDGKANGGAFGRVFGWTDKIASPNRLSTGSGATTSNPAQPLLGGKTGREAYWPSSLDKECEKAARILKSFCSDGFLSHETSSAPSSEPTSPTTASRPPTPPNQTQVMKKIPPRIVQNAVGLAIFSCMRSGLWMSGSGGSGILIARKADGTWSPPSGIILHTAGLGFAIGVDIYDCVLVINSVAALEMFTRPRLVLGTDVSLAVGPVACVGLLENDPTRWRELSGTVLTYLKARGQHREVRLDGSMVTERGNENERFYGTTVDVLDVLAGNVRKSIPEIAPLFEAIKAAEGRTDFDLRMMQALSLQPAPGDAVIETPVVSPASPMSATFGLPSSDDPDPFGVIALEMAGLEIREAGTRLRPTSTQFDYSPSPTSLAFNFNANANANANNTSSGFHRQSVDTYVSHSNSNRGSYMSSRTQATTMTDAFTQTDVGESARTSPSPSRVSDLKDRTSAECLPVVLEPEEIDYTKIDMTALELLNRRESVDMQHVSAPATITNPTPKSAPVASLATSSTSETGLPRRQDTQTTQATIAATTPDDITAPSSERDDDADDEDDEEEDDEEEPVIFEVATAQQPARAAIMTTQVTQVISAKGALVTIPKRIPPALPPRNPARSSRASKSEFGDVSSLKSPVRQSFDSAASGSIPHVSISEEQQQVNGDGDSSLTACADATLLAADVTAIQTDGPGVEVISTSTSTSTSISDGANDGANDCASNDISRTTNYHHRASSSVYTTILQASTPAKNTTATTAAPSTPTATTSAHATATAMEHGLPTPAADDESSATSTSASAVEPLTPKTFEDIRRPRQHNDDANDDEAKGENNNNNTTAAAMKIVPDHLSATTIRVA